MKILVVEDDQAVAQVLQVLLAGYNYAVDIAADGDAGLQMADAFDYDLILLDVILPKLDGISLCQQLRAKGFQKPILLLTGQGEGRQKAIALNAGADDYVVKPFNTEELIARVQALLRRGGPMSQPVLTWGRLSVDPSHRRVSYGTHLLPVTPKEYAILELFLRNPQTALSAKRILDHAWTSLESPGEEAVRVHIKELRHKLTAVGAPKDLIKTKHRVGYQLNPLYASLVPQTADQLTLPQVAELNAVNEELRATLEQLQSAQAELQQRNQELQASRDELEQRMAERTAELSQREAFLSSIYDGAEQSIFVVDVTAPNDFRYVSLNRSAQQSIGMSLQDFQGKTPEEVFGLETGSLFRQHYNHCVQANSSITYEDHFVFNNCPIWTLTTLSPLRNRAGRIDRIVGTVSEITEHKQAEIALHKSEAEFRGMFNLTGVGMAQADPKTRRFLQVNQAFCAITGYSEAELLSLTVDDLNYPDDRAIDQQRYNNLLHGDGYQLEKRYLRKDGSTVWVLVTGNVVCDTDGQPIVAFAMVQDISKLKQLETDRKQTEFALQQQLLREQVIADIAQDIRQSLDLNQVLSRTVERVRDLLDTDRVLIFRFRPDWQGDVMMESIGVGWPSILSTTIFDPCFRDHYIEPYRQGRIAAMSDIDQENREPCYIELLQSFQVKANLIVPILQGEHLWGLLIAHHCSAPRQWQSAEIELLRQLATQVGIAIQQSELYEQTRNELAERERMQSVLEESEERFRSISATAPIGICQTNADGICLYTNAYWHKMSGLSFEDSLGNGWLQVVHPDDREPLCAAWEAYTQGECGQLLDFRLVTPEGAIRWVSAKVATLRSATGEITGYVRLDEDITERKQVEAALRESEQRLQAILDHSPAIIYLLDLQNQHLLVNRSCAALVSMTPEEIIGKSIYEIWPMEAANTFAASNRTVLETCQLLQLEEVVSHPDGKQHTYITVKFPLCNTAGTPYAICGISTDITEKKQLETQFYRAQRLESLGTLASGIAHDLNNVLTPIVAISQLLRLKHLQLDAQSQKMLQILEESAKRGAAMIQQILTFTRGTGGECRSVQIASLVQEVITMIQQTFPQSISIRQTIPEQSPWLVSADPTFLHQVLMNLCVNARDAMPDGGVLSISVEQDFVDQALAQINLDAHVGNHVVVTIADTGTGIPPEVRDQIFDPFFTTKSQGEGTGLGLATVLGIVRNYGGFLQVFSEVGQGTAVKVFLPIIEGSPTSSSQSQAQLHGDGKLVLVVDDDVAVQYSAQALLESHQYTVLLANDGVEAIALYAEHQVEIRLVILDIMMPKMSGVLLIQSLKEINPEVKIIAVSGLSTNREPALAAGAKAFLSKPYTLKDLLQTVQDLIGE